jgi:hypothetical protein
MTDNLTQGVEIFRYNGSQNEFVYSRLQLWERITTMYNDMACDTTGGYTVILEADDICDFKGGLGGTDFVLDVHTDEYEAPIYPKITLALNSHSNVIETDCEPTDIADGFVYYYKMQDLYFWKDDKGQIRTSNSNQSGIMDSKIMIGNTYTDSDGETHTVMSEINNNMKGETIIIDGANKVISSDRDGGRIFGDDFDWNWIPLMNGQNTLTVIANCTVTVEWREPIKVGQYC